MSRTTRTALSVLVAGVAFAAPLAVAAPAMACTPHYTATGPTFTITGSPAPQVTYNSSDVGVMVYTCL